MLSHWNVASGNEVVMDSWRFELTKGNAGELRAPVVCARTHCNRGGNKTLVSWTFGGCAAKLRVHAILS